LSSFTGEVFEKVENLYQKNFKNLFKTTRTILSAKLFCKNQGGVKTAVGSELSLVSGTYHENKVSVVMEMASFSLKIRHVFGDTLLTERSIGAGPPVIIQLSGVHWYGIVIIHPHSGLRALSMDPFVPFRTLR
jgi:hypothetical protein